MISPVSNRFCRQEGCTGHIGKFSSCRDEALYFLALERGTFDHEPTAPAAVDGSRSYLVTVNDNALVRVDELTVLVPAGDYTIVINDMNNTITITSGNRHDV